MPITRQLGAIAAVILGALVVVDGDTVRLDGKAYRLLGFDTPETARGALRNTASASLLRGDCKSLSLLAMPGWSRPARTWPPS